LPQWEHILSHASLLGDVPREVLVKAAAAAAAALLREPDRLPCGTEGLAGKLPRL
jgi:hypothetical protein